MTEEEKNAAAAYVKLHDDVRQLVRDSLIASLRSNDYELTTLLQNLTLGSHLLDSRVKQVITNQMQR